MRSKSIINQVLAPSAMLIIACSAHAGVIFGSFEGSQTDGFGAFSNSSGVIPFASGTSGATYAYSTSYGATDGTTSLVVSHAGFTSNDLAYDFKNNGIVNHVADFLANDILSFDVTAPVSATNAGYWQIYTLALNAPGAGFQNVGGTAPIANEYPPYNGTPLHVSINYDAFKANVAANPGYLQMIITTNNGGGAPTDFYFDNFQLSPGVVPEPASLSLIIIAGAGMLVRRRRA